MTAEAKLTLMFKKAKEDYWKDISIRIKPDSKPSGNNQTKNNLFQYQLAFDNPVTDDNVTRVYPDNGDEIVICDSQSRNSVMGKSCAGKILKKELTGNGYSGNFADGTLTQSLNYNLTIRQHEFSKRVFPVEREITTPLNTILDEIILENTLDMLGGVFIEENGTTTVIPKYINYAENVDIAQYVLKKGTVPIHLNELLKIPAYNWALKYYSRYNATYGIKLIAQVAIWQD